MCRPGHGGGLRPHAVPAWFIVAPGRCLSFWRRGRAAGFPGLIWTRRVGSRSAPVGSLLSPIHPIYAHIPPSKGIRQTLVEELRGGCRSRRFSSLPPRIPPLSFRPKWRNLGAGGREGEDFAFLTHLATHRHVSASTRNQALSALLFLYRNVLDCELGDLDSVRAKRSKRLPVVLTRSEVLRLLDRMDGVPRLVATLLYGAGLRLQEALSLRVKDLARLTGADPNRCPECGKAVLLVVGALPARDRAPPRLRSAP